jgi:hypothetical protein
MTEILVKVGFGLVIFFIAIYYSTKYLASKAHSSVIPTTEELSKQIEQELFNVEEREVVGEEVVVVEKEPKPEFPIDKPKKKRKYYPKKKK